MLAARYQAEQYAKAIPDDWPTFLVIVDVGYSIELYADLSLTGRNYAHFADRNTFRIRSHELVNPEVRNRLLCSRVAQTSLPCPGSSSS